MDELDSNDENDKRRNGDDRIHADGEKIRGGGGNDLIRLGDDERQDIVVLSSGDDIVRQFKLKKDLIQ